MSTNRSSAHYKRGEEESFLTEYDPNTLSMARDTACTHPGASDTDEQFDNETARQLHKMRGSHGTNTGTRIRYEEPEMREGQGQDEKGMRKEYRGRVYQ